MKNLAVPWLLCLALPLGLVGVLSVGQLKADASDHADSPSTQADPLADLASYYAFVNDGNFTAVLTFAPNSPAGSFDADLLYTLHIDIDADDQADHSIHMRFGQKASGDWGIQASDIPGQAAPIVGDVETLIETGAVKLFAGLRDDPFFFDLNGYIDTLQTGNIAFTASDAFAGLNVMAIAIEFPSSVLASTTLRSWASSSRIGGTP